MLTIQPVLIKSTLCKQGIFKRFTSIKSYHIHQSVLILLQYPLSPTDYLGFTQITRLPSTANLFVTHFFKLTLTSRGVIA